MKTAVFILTVIVMTALGAQAQSDPLSAAIRADYTRMKNNVIRSAEEMPESEYGFRPTPDVRTFGQQIAHVADDQYNYCYGAKGEVRKAAYSELENTLSKKTDLVAALKQAFAYCDGAYDSLTDASAAQMMAAGKVKLPKLAILTYNTSHTSLHYGNIIVYLRLKGLVPPSSQRSTQAAH